MPLPQLTRFRACQGWYSATLLPCKRASAQDARMPFRRTLLLSLLLLSLLAAAQDVTIYRCLGPGGKLTLRDSPCAAGETQQVRSMQRPKDPAPSAMPAAPVITAPTPPPVREVQVIYRTPPRPLYECVTTDGERYTSENGEGNPRWVPAWTVGYPRWSSRGPRSGPPLGQPDRPNHPPSHGMLVPISGTWVRDECHALPQTEVCARLSDQRYALIRRYNSALQGERRQLELEQRGIEARLSNDCGIN